MRILITQVSSFKKDTEATRCEAAYLVDKANTSMSVELCKAIHETKGLMVIPYSDDADLLFQLGRIINKNDTFVVGSLYSKLPKSVIADYKIEQIGKKGTKAPVKAKTPAPKKEAEPKKEPVAKKAPAPKKEAEPKKESVAKKAPAPKKEAKPAKQLELPLETPKKPKKRKGEDVSAYMDSVAKYITEVEGDDLAFVIRVVREAAQVCGDDRMAKGMCKTKLKKEFGEELGMKIYEALDAKFTAVKSSSGV